MKTLSLFSLLLFIAFPVLAETQLTFECAFSEDDRNILVTITSPLAEKNAVCQLSVTNREHKNEAPRQLESKPWPKSGKLSFSFPVTDFQERQKLTFQATLKSQDGKELCTASQNISTPPSPENWRNFTEGIPDGTVPPPWTKVELKGNTVSVWGRTFIFDKSPLPAQIISQNVKLLRKPASLILEPAPSTWTLLSAESVNDATARLKWKATLPTKQTVTATTEIYFDGVLRLDINFPQNCNIIKYAQRYDIEKNVAQTLHRGPWAFGGIKTTYKVKDTVDSHPIRPQLFLFNDYVGFGWFDGMMFDWPLHTPSKALVVTPNQDDTVSLQVNYIDEATAIKKARTYTTGLQPLPVRPMPEKEDALKMCYAVQYVDMDTKAWDGTVDYYTEGNFDIQTGTAEMFVKFAFDPKTQKGEELFWSTSHGKYIRFKLGWTPKDGVFAQIYEDCITKAYVASQKHPDKDEWFHIAVTWGDEIALFLNGEKVGATPYNGSNRVAPAMIHTGGDHVFLDAFRVSDIPRTQFTLDAPPTADAHTLLLDNFDKRGFCNGRRATFPEKMSATTEAGYPTPDANFAKGRWGDGLSPVTNPPRNLIEGYSYYGIDTFCFHANQYTDEAMAGMYIEFPDKMNRIVKQIHKLGKRAIIYLNNSLTNYDRAWDAHKDDWLIEPKGYPFIQASRPEEKSYQACPRSEYINYFFWRLAALMDEYKLDGGFLDGRMYTTCHNTRHGCQVTNFDGKDVPKRDVWDGRLKAQRLYTIIKNRGGYCEQHKSSIWDAPTCFFWDGAWEGEQFMMQKWNPSKGERKKILPVEAMRSQMNGFVYGMPCRFTAYYLQPFSGEDYCTYSFVHGTTWTMTYRIHEAAITAPYWKALSDFGATYKNFIPYWSTEPPALETPDTWIKVSAYKKQGKVLLLVANFNEQQPAITGNIKLNLKKLGLPPTCKAVNAFSGETIPMNDNSLPISIKSFRQDWFILTE